MSYYIKNSYPVKTFIFILLILTITIFNTAAFPADAVPDIIIYGNEKCGYCKDTMLRLKNEGIEFVYRDVELYGTNQEEMFAKLERAGFTSTAYFPVIDVKGQILMRPEFDDIKKALSGQKIDRAGEKKIRDTRWRPQRNKSLRTDFNSIRKTLKDSDMIIYDDGSGNGNVLLKQLKKEQIPFTLRQLNKLGNAAYFDMSSRLAALGYGNVTHFPVVEVRGEMIMKPSIEDVKILIVEMIPD
ncbi:MAG TPA: glutaredoxin family protein [Spirochaetota bacterium]|nr:glutaredoxin family protein [Spirochaetota bacterium]HPS86049.1 glutaredoxin family protein [Spirochaetota bacterium]